MASEHYLSITTHDEGGEGAGGQAPRDSVAVWLVARRRKVMRGLDSSGGCRVAAQRLPG